jgi:anti-anti-sigma factor
VDPATAPALKIILDQIAKNSPREVRIELSAISFFACRGLSVLMATQHRLAQHEAALVVDGAVGIVRRVFILNGLSNLLSPMITTIPRYCAVANAITAARCGEACVDPLPTVDEKMWRTRGATTMTAHSRPWAAGTLWRTCISQRRPMVMVTGRNCCLSHRTTIPFS